jgi:hypothetical protein
MSFPSVEGVVYRRAATITKHDSTNIASGVTDAIHVGGAGTMTVVFQDDSTCQFTCAAGDILPVRAKRVNSTGTAATAMSALYQNG